MADESEVNGPTVDFKERVARSVESLKAFLKRQSTIILWTVIVLLAVLAVPAVRDLVTKKRIVLLTGPEGGLYRRMGQKVEDEFQKQSSWKSSWKFWGRTFEVTSQETEGDEENRETIEKDTTGSFIGFTQDGYKPSPNIRSVLHLYDAPLHIVARKDFYLEALDRRRVEEQAFRSGNVPEKTFSVIASDLRTDDCRGKVYLGTPKSGTRQSATIVLNHYGIANPDEIAIKRDYSPKGAGYALIDGTIKLAFFSIQRGAPVLDKLVEDQEDKLVILSLDDAEGIISAHPFLVPGEIKRHAYSSIEDFPDRDVKTVASRQVMICSPKMSDSDVFWLAQTIDSSLRDNLPDVPWAKDISPETQKSEFRYPRHPGAVKFENKQEPSFVAGMKYVIAVVLAPTALKSINAIFAFLWGLLMGAKTQEPDRSRLGYEQVNSDLERLLSELEQQPMPVPAATLSSFTARGDELDKRIAESFDKKVIDKVQRESMLRGLKNVRFELAELKAPEKPLPPEVLVSKEAAPSPTKGPARSKKT
jgi:TRAP-type uncharacterized transport system substrate-binding protein